MISKGNSILEYKLDLDSDRDKIFVISPTLTSCEGIESMYSKADVIILTSEYQAHMPNNYIIINPDVSEYTIGEDYYTNRYKGQGDFQNIISNNIFLDDLISKLSKRCNVYLKPITLTNGLDVSNYNVQLLATPKESLVVDSKIFQRKTLGRRVPLIDGCISNRESLYANFNKYNDGNGCAIAVGYGGSGSGIRRVKNDVEFEKFLKDFNDKEFVVSTWLDLESSPSMLGIVDKEGNSLIFSPSIQCIEDTFWRGSIFDKRKLSNTHVIRQMEDIYRIVANVFSRETRFMGILGIDYGVDYDNNVYFIESNPRFTGTTMETLVNSVLGSPLSYDLGVLLGERINNDIVSSKFNWVKKRFFSPVEGKINNTFKKISLNELFECGGVTSFNIKPSGTLVKKGDRIATVVAVGNQHPSILEKIVGEEMNLNYLNVSPL